MILVSESGRQIRVCVHDLSFWPYKTETFIALILDGIYHPLDKPHMLSPGDGLIIRPYIVPLKELKHEV